MLVKRIIGGGAALAFGLAIAFVPAATAGEDTLNGVTQSFDVAVDPSSKLPKKVTKKQPAKGVAANIAVGVSEVNQEKPPAAQQVILDLDKDLFITPKGLAKCSESTITVLTTTAAREACKKSVVGTGDASATCGAGPPGIPDVDVTAFNGEPSGKNGVIFLHTYADLGGTEQIQILRAVLKDAPGKELGVRADISVPPLAGGACSIVDFQVTLKKKFKKKGKKYDYVSAVCSDKLWEHESTFNFVQPNPFGVATLRPPSEQACKAK
jgi:hypothetical protein